MSVHGVKVHPVLRLWEIMSADKKDLFVLLIYTLISGTISLAVPLAAQALVNTIAAGVFLQPLLVLSIIVLSGLLLAGLVRITKFCLIENLQQRIFARITLQLSRNIPSIKCASLNGEYMPELINRFFDVMNVQKCWSKLLLEVPSALLQIFVGLILMAVYSPYLLAFDFLIITFVFFVLAVLGLGGLRTSITESVSKYKVAEWLEDMGRCQNSFKLNASSRFLLNRSDSLVMDYLNCRSSHFSVLFRQAFACYFFQALGSAGILAIGGWLVINRELTLGQLVASELVLLGVLNALEKVVRNCETFYDLLTGLDKVGHIADMPLEREGGAALAPGAGMRVDCMRLGFSYERLEVLKGLDLSIGAGERVSLVGASGAGKTTLASIICGLQDPSHGTVELDGLDVRDLNLRDVRKQVGFVGDINEIFEGSLEENVSLGRSSVSHQDCRWALECSQFSDDLLRMPDGIKTSLISAGKNLSRGQVQRLLLARAIVERPRLLILDEAFTGIDERTKLQIIDNLFSEKNAWTVLDISHDSEVVARSDKVHVLADGLIVESGSPSDLAWRNDSEFSRLFPELAKQIRKVDRRKTERLFEK